jgi:phage terminase large subunit-like protein
LYEQWVKSGLLNVTKGAVINYNNIQEEIESLRESYSIREIAFDRWGLICSDRTWKTHVSK